MVEQHLIYKHYSVREVLTRLDRLALNAIVFLVDNKQRLLGSLTDGDIRRGLVKGLDLNDEIEKFVHYDTKYFRKGKFDFFQMKEFREHHYTIIPVLDENDSIVDIVNFNLLKSFLPLDAVIMAGGKGARLLPLTLHTPKPLLVIGDKPIVEHNIDRLKDFGVRNITLSVKYLGQKIVDYFSNGAKKDVNISYVEESKPLGTIGSVGLVEQFQNDYILVMNADVLTNIDYEDMFQELLVKEADMVVATAPYEVQIPFGIVETDDDEIVALKEKPTYTYYSNSGIYIFKREYLDYIPKGECFDATDLIKLMNAKGKRVVSFPILDYWLDIGRPDDLKKAIQDIKHIKF